jgi:hypothetical protein
MVTFRKFWIIGKVPVTDRGILPMAQDPSLLN